MKKIREAKKISQGNMHHITKAGHAHVSNFETQLFKAADKLRKNIDAAEYKHVVLGLIFLKYISDTFEALYQKLSQDELADPEDRDEYLAENVFFVPEKARWRNIQAQAKLPEIGKVLDEAMDAIEKENPELKNVLPKVYGKPNLDKTSLGGLIDIISDLDLKKADDDAKDIFGRVYEYFLGEFASNEGKKAGEFYTPRSVVALMVEMIEPYRGRVYDPACGSGGMFVISEKFVQEHQGRINDITIYGQESNLTTWKLSKMNLAIRHINSQFVVWNKEGTLLKDAHPDLKADYILANPPFNQSDWGQELLKEDARWKYGIPPAGNANFAWLQHILYHLKPEGGVMATLLANGSLSSMTGGEGEIRKNLVNAGLVDCIVSLPSKLFYNVQIPATIWILRRGKKERQNEVLFIDASQMGKLINRKQRILTKDDIAKIAGTYHAWRKGENYQDEVGFCKSATLEEIAQNDYILTPGRYVGIPEDESDNVPFEEKMQELTSKLAEQVKQEEKLNQNLKEQLKKVGFEI